MAIQGLASVTAAILAGGLGTRLQPVVADRPKVLAEIRGRPFLAHLLDYLAAAGLKHVVLCTGYLGEHVRAAFGDSYGDLRLVYSLETTPLGTAGALSLALPLLKSDPVLVINGDSFCDAELDVCWAWHQARKANATLVLARMSDTARYGRVHTAADGTILSFAEKSKQSGPGWINAGIYLLAQSLLLTIPRSTVVSLESDMFPVWIGQGFSGYQCPGRFLDIGTPEGYKAAENFFDGLAAGQNRFGSVVSRS